ncbi:MAG TPA: LacI family DNA-binding transcriptional regulator [Anaerolineales bacterium]|nr:LacI family DNA-binding transcriptional regulator [Anaerolineales bacterium]
MRPTIRDVAKKLNLSITTVSRALDGYDDVADETRQLVIDTARKLGYSPNRAARQLRRQKAETVGYILPAGAQHFAEPFFTEFIAGLGNELAPRNYDLLVSAVASETEEQEMYRRWAESGKVDGFILNRLRLQDWRVKFLLKQHVPFATLDYSGTGRYPCIRVDGSDGFVELVQHIRQNGFERFAFIGGPANLVSQSERLNWFRGAIQFHELALDDGLVTTADLTSTGGYQSAIELLSLPDPPDAVFCVNDETAFGVLHAAHQRGLAIGQQLAVAGFDGVQEAKHTEPPLTTLDIPVFDIARQLVDMLLKTIAGESVTSPVLIKPNLLIRPSTGG